MRLHDIESAYLLPRFAHDAEWEQNALDQVVKGVRAKSFAMVAPYTRKAIAALSDAELQAFYFQYGIAIYYPDLSRETRENMLFELARVYRSLGTPHSVELLCEYIFDGSDKVVVEIHDNLAFNAAGELVDDSLLDLFDVDLFPTSPELSQDKIERIVENIFRFCRNSQTLRDIIIEFPDVAELPIASCDLESFVYTIGGDEIAVVPEPESDYEFIFVDSTTGRVTYGVENLTEIEFSPTGYFTIDEGSEVIFVEQSPFPVVCVDEGTRTQESVAPDDSFDTELPYYASKLYIVTTDDGQDETLYGWEAEEGTPVVVLPTVTISSKWLIINPGGNVTIDVNGTHDTKIYNDSSELVPSVYDSSKVYAIIRAASAPFFVVTRGGMKCEDVNGTIGVRNVTSSSISVYQAEYAYCEDTSVTVVTVYDGTLVPYNAFKYTAGGTDYYYVLDSVQTDWTDDLSSIGYNPGPYIDMLIGMKWNSDETALEAVTDFNYYWSRVITSEDKSTLNTLGLWVDPGFLKFGSLKYPSSGYSLTLIAVYYDMGITEGDVSQFVINSYSSDGGNVAGLYAPNHYTGTGIMTWKVRITKL